jgi:hypothetical protein
MKIQKATLYALVILLLTSCSEGEKGIESKPKQVFTSEEEKLLNEVFLSIIGTDLYYTISDKEMDMVYEIESKEGQDKAQAYYEEHRKEDPTPLVVFTRDEFVNMYSSLDSKSLNPERLEHIKHILIENSFDTSTHILEMLSQPLELSSAYLIRTGRYQVFREQDKGRVKGEYKLFGSFNISKIYIDDAKDKAVFIYEKNCMDGFKCAEGNLLILKNGKDGWKIIREFKLYIT